MVILITRKERFIKVSNNLNTDTDLQIILLDHKNNYIGRQN